MILDRRAFLAGTVALPALARARISDPLAERLAAIERAGGGRLGVAVFDSGTGRHATWRGDERFPMCSTFKLLAAALVLRRVERSAERLDRVVRYRAGDLVPYSPETEKHVADGMTIGALCEAAITLSDNTAGNLLLASFGGPEALTAFARSLGDPVTRLDRTETSLNTAIPGDPRDTTSPNAMLGDMRRLLLGQVLSTASRGQLLAWLEANKTGGSRLRAGLPPGWRVGDKTGSGAHGTSNDVAILWPPRRPPILVAAYLTEGAEAPEKRDAMLAEVGRAVASA